ncbi:diguanylate cyclase [uncultured Jatrophihabitans sp.]|uniref:GGDEF domain-containing protein n=1 Tax=uncultured Jatrophihabitans sp. TaxID=1610747 RepID=UPI0035C97802
MGSVETTDTSAARAWPITTVPRPFAAYLLCIDAFVLLWVVRAVLVMPVSWAHVGRLALVAGVAIAFEEAALRATRLQLRLSADLKRDMVSVWAVAVAVAFDPGYAALLLLMVLAYTWFRQLRPAGEILYRKCFSGSTELLGCLCAGVVVDAVTTHSSLPLRLSGTLAVVLAVAVYTTINRVCITVALVWVGVRGRDLVGSRDANLTELATLCLGGLVGVAIAHEPWLVILALVPMITLQRGAVVRELETVAITDAKTGLLNAVALEHLGEREVARAEREGTALAVLIADIDHFKLVNDRHGHLVGDSVLRGVGKVLTVGVREYDTVGRFGGEEFVAILPNADQREALVVAERLRTRIAALRIADLDAHVDADSEEGLTVSIGIACYRVDGFVMPDLLFAADAALYQAKAGGRNRVVIAEGGGEDTDREAVTP